MTEAIYASAASGCSLFFQDYSWAPWRCSTFWASVASWIYLFCVRRANSHDGGDWGITVSGYLYVHRLDQ
ncbi:MAG: hypothetical protein CM15mP120_13840 [Pseudomonadota bacterium]|nr:MAG: hypothetical protein CM15mP120_13840 [Pseudomonadota bacterium]